MMERIRRTLKDVRNEKGFTLIEMAIVLIIIGIIIGSIVKGKDIMRSAQIKKAYTKYFNAWNIAYMTHYDRTGTALTASTITSGLARAGIDSPGTTYTYKMSDGNSQTVAVSFDDTDANYTYMDITNIPSELGMAIDMMIDGSEDGLGGDFLAFESGGTTAAAWSDTPTTLLDARWKMEF